MDEVIPEGLKVRDFAKLNMATINEGAEILKSLVKDGHVQIEVLETTARIGKESETALKMLRKEGLGN